MTTVLAIIGGIAVILGAATKIPPAVCALVRACIPLVTAFDDLRDAILHRRKGVGEAGADDEVGLRPSGQ